MTTLVLVRHGRSTSNTAGTLAGRTPGISLDETGESQAMRAGERLRGLRLDLAVRSPILRCQQTLDLALASAALTPEVVVDDRFTECDYGAWSNRPLKELADEPLWKTVQATPSQVRFPDGESMAEMYERVREGVARGNELAQQRAPQGSEPTWLLVGHGDPIKAILSQALQQDFDDFQRIMVDPASISIIRYPAGSDGVPMVVAMNTTHGQVHERIGAAPPPSGPQVGGGLGSQQD